MDIVKRNLYCLYFIKIAKWFMLFMPVIVLFYQANGLNMAKVLLLQGIYSVAIIALEMPSGYFADVWGRKNTIIIGSILGTIGFVIYALTDGFWGFLFAELILGFGQSFISGSDSALLYDSLLAGKRENEYMKYEGRIISLGNFSEAGAAIVGGFLAEISLRTPFIAQIVIAAIAIPASFLLIEPNVYVRKSKVVLSDFTKILKFAMIENPGLKMNIYFSAIIGACTLTMAWFIQPYLKNTGYSVATIGIIWALLNLSVGLSSMIAYKVERKLGSVKTMLLIVSFICGSYIIAGIFNSRWVVAVFFVFYIVRGIATPVLKEYINKFTSSEMRATVLSIRNFMIRIIFAAVAPFFGWLSDAYTLNTALILSGSIFLFFCLIAFYFWYKVEK